MDELRLLARVVADNTLDAAMMGMGVGRLVHRAPEALALMLIRERRVHLETIGADQAIDSTNVGVTVVQLRAQHVALFGHARHMMHVHSVSGSPMLWSQDMRIVVPLAGSHFGI
jgi:hypothetical protein